MLYCFVLAKSPNPPPPFSSHIFLFSRLLYFRHWCLLFWLNLDLSHSLGWTNDWDVLFPWSHSIFHSHSHTDTHILPPHFSHFSLFSAFFSFFFSFQLPLFILLQQSGENHKNPERFFSSTYFIPSGSGIYRKSLSVLAVISFQSSSSLSPPWSHDHGDVPSLKWSWVLV